MSTESKCPFHTMAAGGRGNRDWWPEQLNLGMLHQQSAKSNPMGEGFDYARDFFHPNDRGHELWAEALWPSVQAVLAD